MTLTQVYPPITVNASGVASEATLQSVLTSVNNVLEEVSKDILFHFYEDPNTLTGAYQTMWTVAGKALESIKVKQNDGNNLSIAVNGVEKLVCPPSGEVQDFPFKAPIGATIDIKVLGTVSNAGPISIEFLG